jgi:hypothetical protein
MEDTQYRRVILEQISQCAMGGPLSSCVLREYRKCSNREVVEQLDRLSTVELKELWSKHLSCVEERKEWLQQLG